METDEARRREHEQAKSQLSIVAPFATPPPTPRPNRRDYDDDLDAEYDKRDMALGQIRAKRGDDLAGTTISRLSSLSPANGFRRTESRVTAGSKEDAGNQYAWSMLADHLRLPENAMGLMSMEMNDSNARWQDARRNVEQQFFPGVMVSWADPPFAVPWLIRWPIRHRLSARQRVRMKNTKNVSNPLE